MQADFEEEVVKSPMGYEDSSFVSWILNSVGFFVDTTIPTPRKVAYAIILVLGVLFFIGVVAWKGKSAYDDVSSNISVSSDPFELPIQICPVDIYYTASTASMISNYCRKYPSLIKAFRSSNDFTNCTITNTKPCLTFSISNGDLKMIGFDVLKSNYDTVVLTVGQNTSMQLIQVPGSIIRIKRVEYTDSKSDMDSNSTTTYNFQTTPLPLGSSTNITTITVGNTTSTFTRFQILVTVSQYYLTYETSIRQWYDYVEASGNLIELTNIFFLTSFFILYCVVRQKSANNNHENSN